jgi:hypothetical protein
MGGKKGEGRQALHTCRTFASRGKVGFGLDLIFVPLGLSAMAMICVNAARAFLDESLQ